MFHCNHKGNIYGRYTEENQKGIKAYPYQKNKNNVRQTESNEQMSTVSPSLSVVTLNVNGLNSLTKRHGMAEQVKERKERGKERKARKKEKRKEGSENQDPTISCLQESNFRCQN